MWVDLITSIWRRTNVAQRNNVACKSEEQKTYRHEFGIGVISRGFTDSFFESIHDVFPFDTDLLTEHSDHFHAELFGEMQNWEFSTFSKRLTRVALKPGQL